MDDQQRQYVLHLVGQAVQLQRKKNRAIRLHGRGCTAATEASLTAHAAEQAVVETIRRWGREVADDRP